MRKSLRLSYNAPVVLSFVIACFTITILGVITNNRLTSFLFSVYRGSLTNPLTFIRLFTHVFGHVGFDHFIGNATYLLLVGPMIEEKYGSSTIVKVMTATALVTGVINCTLFASASLCGASGIVFAFIILSSFTAFRDGEIPISFLLIAFLFIGKEIYSGIVVQDNISNLTHIVGGTIGGFSGYALNRGKK